jgi:hypothetical protein
MTSDRVEDHEQLYRVAKPEFVGQDGRLKPSAFNDRYKRPSVDRAHLIGNDPTRTHLYQPGDFVLELLASDIREIPVLEEKDEKDRKLPDVFHKVDVEPVKEGHHAAHAEIFTTRVPNNGASTPTGVFKRLQIRLAEIARILQITES